MRQLPQARDRDKSMIQQEASFASSILLFVLDVGSICRLSSVIIYAQVHRSTWWNLMDDLVKFCLQIA